MRRKVPEEILIGEVSEKTLQERTERKKRKKGKEGENWRKDSRRDILEKRSIYREIISLKKKCAKS